MGKRPDRRMRNRRGVDITEADVDEDTPTGLDTDFVTVENSRHERFSEEFPEGAYGAPDPSRKV